MAKVKVTKKDIIDDNVEMPDGYKIIKYKTKDEIDAENSARADELEAGLGDAPDDVDLINYAKQDHPYYQTLEEIEDLRKIK